jgi:DNA modification methylase
VFTPPPDLPKARSGVDYPQDIWPIGSVGRVQRRAGETRYRNELPGGLVRRLFAALTRPPTLQQADLVVEPFLGGGTGAQVAQELGLRYIGADINPHSIPFAMHRLDIARAGLAGRT